MEWISFGLKWATHYIVEGGGDSLFISDPEFTAIPWSVLSPLLVVGQILFLMFINKFYANGNALLIGL